ncbi:unnamed protein product [Timema podura]|uniref:SHSP domain-containing protein n=1 Tax=Timema podura TaxID=61482 RepID=A0ABN7PT80_TIMPD|nr:unnamed protein product [Timema podura]
MLHVIRLLVPKSAARGGRNIATLSQHNNLAPVRQFVNWSRIKALAQGAATQVQQKLVGNLSRPGDTGSWDLKQVSVQGEIAGKDAPFKMRIGFKGFAADDIKISVKDNIIIIHATISRKEKSINFLMTETIYFTLPSNVDITTLQAFFSEDGVLTLESGDYKSRQRRIPIEHIFSA